MQEQPGSIWQKLRRRKTAMGAIYVIVFACLIALFAYPIAPDSSPNANRMIVELAARPPGFTKSFLKLPRPKAAERKSFLARLFTGQQPAYNLLPINSYFFARDTIIVQHYIDEGISDTLAFPLKSLIPPSSAEAPAGEATSNPQPPTSNVQRPTSNANLSAPALQKQARSHSITRKIFLLGTDRYGRDILSRLLIGTRVSIAAGFIAVVLSLSIGIFLGCIAGYYRGWVDNVVMYLISILSAIPGFLLVFAISLTLGKGFLQIFIAIGLTMWVSAARLIRGKVLVLRELEYVQAARMLGLSDMRIMFRHILPNMAGPLMVIAASNFAAAILMEAGLSFLGIGVQPPIPSWGLMIREHHNFLLTNRPVLLLIPGIAIIILACAFNILGNALKDVMVVERLKG